MNTKAVIFGLLITSFIIGNIYRFSFFSPQVRISFLDISVIILTIVSLVRNKGRIIIKPVAVFAVVSLFSLLLSTRYGLPAQMIGSFYWLRWVMYTSLPILFANSVSSLSLRRLMIILSLINYII